ncbi:hypothetical protein BVG79_02050 [Ketogulonicigenium robustum]|uniref:Uncharacterized protein n=1 Tax=Ketogulonicigenium robustum TaxID=92947 RepID=A0A1W6P224_9RHOB|nr:hypothetical protein BVG79_02050 [Ketogulonicigenium robustum]
MSFLGGHGPHGAASLIGCAKRREKVSVPPLAGGQRGFIPV